MSELKAYYPYANRDGFYHKSEVDKFITDLEESHKMEVEQLLMEIVELKADYKEACDRLQTANLIKDEQLAATRHHKHKRCLAMAEWCKARYDEEDAKLNRWASSWDYVSNEMKYWERWQWRWDALAEKFKEAK